MSVLERCPSYRESNKGSKERQGPTLGVRFTEVSVKRESTVPFFFLMRDPPLNTSNNRSKHLYQSDHVVISISVFCLSNIDRRIVFVLIAVLFINFVLFSAFVHVAVGFA